MKTRDIVNQAVSEMTASLKAIKQGDEDDLGSLAGSFDEIAQQADNVAGLLSRADQALSGEEEQPEEEPEGEEPEPDEK